MATPKSKAAKPSRRKRATPVACLEESCTPTSCAEGYANGRARGLEESISGQLLALDACLKRKFAERARYRRSIELLDLEIRHHEEIRAELAAELPL